MNTNFKLLIKLLSLAIVFNIAVLATAFSLTSELPLAYAQEEQAVEEDPAAETPAETPSETPNFPDVKVGSPYYQSSQFLKANGIIEGYSDGTFKPNQPINRAEALKIINLAFNFQEYSFVERPLSSIQISEDQDLSQSAECNFSDVPKDQWYFEFVCEALINQVVEGYPDGTFKPEQTINKVEALKMAILQSGLPFHDDNGDIFSDVSADAWFHEYARMAKQKTLYVPDRSNNLHAGETLNRGEFGLLIYRIHQYQKFNSEFGKATFYGKSFHGRNTASGEKLNMNEYQAAHKTLPFGTKVKVTNLANGKSIVAKVIDRGPYVHGVIIDLTTGAFSELASLGTGIINIEVEVIEG